MVDDGAAREQGARRPGRRRDGRPMAGAPDGPGRVGGRVAHRVAAVLVGMALLTGLLAATVPTPDSATSFTWIRARGLALRRSKMSCARSSIE